MRDQAEAQGDIANALMTRPLLLRFPPARTRLDAETFAKLEYSVFHVISVSMRRSFPCNDSLTRFAESIYAQFDNITRF